MESASKYIFRRNAAKVKGHVCWDVNMRVSQLHLHVIIPLQRISKSARAGMSRGKRENYFMPLTELSPLETKVDSGGGLL